MTYVLITAKLGVTGHHWLAVLAAFDFSIKYPGKSNGHADGLSRLPITNKYVQYNYQSVGSIQYAECIAVGPDLLKDSTYQQISTSTADIIDWKKAQLHDKVHHSSHRAEATQIGQYLEMTA